jgi:hypothetical protein
MFSPLSSAMEAQWTRTALVFLTVWHLIAIWLSMGMENSFAFPAFGDVNESPRGLEPCFVAYSQSYQTAPAEAYGTGAGI